MYDITDTIEDVDVKITTMPGIDGDRTVQIAITTPQGTYRQQFEIVEGELKWITIPLKLENGRIAAG